MARSDANRTESTQPSQAVLWTYAVGTETQLPGTEPGAAVPTRPATGPRGVEPHQPDGSGAALSPARHEAEGDAGGIGVGVGAAAVLAAGEPDAPGDADGLKLPEGSARVGNVDGRAEPENSSLLTWP